MLICVLSGLESEEDIVTCPNELVILFVVMPQILKINVFFR